MSNGIAKTLNKFMKNVNIDSIIFKLSPLYRSCQCFFHRPPSFYSRPSGSIMKRKIVAPLFKRFCMTIKFYNFISGGIHSLLNMCSPSTILSAIMTVIVYTINAGVSFSKLFYMRLIRFVHIVFKFFKRIPIALNPPLSISFVSVIDTIFTSFIHIYPNFIKTTTSKPMSKISFTQISHYKRILSQKFFFETPTTSSFSLDNESSPRYVIIPTYTNKFPYSLFTFGVTNYFNRCKSAKFLISNIFHKTINAVRLGAQRLLLPAQTSNNMYIIPHMLK